MIKQEKVELSPIISCFKSTPRSPFIVSALVQAGHLKYFSTNFNLLKRQLKLSFLSSYTWSTEVIVERELKFEKPNRLLWKEITSPLEDKKWMYDIPIFRNNGYDITGIS